MPPSEKLAPVSTLPGASQRTEPCERPASSSPAIGADGSIYVGSYDDKVYALTPSGVFKWSYLTGSSVQQSSPAIGADGSIYVGSDDGNVYALTSSGAFKWSYLTGSYVPSSPATAASGIQFGDSGESAAGRLQDLADVEALEP